MNKVPTFTFYFIISKVIAIYKNHFHTARAGLERLANLGFEIDYNLYITSLKISGSGNMVFDQ